MKQKRRIKKKANKNAQGLEMNVLIVAILLILVAGVLIYFFTTKVQVVGQQSQCITRGGDCIAVDKQCQYVKSGFTCDQGEVCCINPGKLT